MGDGPERANQQAVSSNSQVTQTGWDAGQVYPMPPVDSFFPQPEYRPDAPLCFLHITKTAGTSIRLTIENAFEGERVFPSGSRIYGGGYLNSEAAHAAGDDFTRFDLVCGHDGSRQLQRLPHQANSFIWFREPYDRVLSEFFFAIVQRAARPKSEFQRRINTEPLATVFMDWLQAWPERGIRQAGQLAGVRHRSDLAAWRQQNPDASLTATALDVMRRSFFIGLVEDYERSLNYLAALTGILPPRQGIRHNAGRRRHLELDLTPEQAEQVRARLAQDLEFHELVRGIYERQIDQLQGMAGRNSLLGLCNDREALRASLLERHAASGRWQLGTWHAWDAVLGENMDGREQVVVNGEQVRWRWTGPLDETLLYFDLPASSDLEIVLDLYGATDMANIRAARLLVNEVPIQLSLGKGNPHGHRLTGPIPEAVVNQRSRPLDEFRLQTPVMTDESQINPAAARKLGLAVQRIAVAPAARRRGVLGGLLRRFRTR